MRSLWRNTPLVVATMVAVSLLVLPHQPGELGHLLGWLSVAFCAMVILAAAGVSPFLAAEEFERSGLEAIDHMTGEEFELRLQSLYLSLGYSVRTTPRSGDFGCDLLLLNGLGRKTVVQAKRYASNVGLDAVQEAVAAIRHYDASAAVVVTNSHFTKAAVELAASNGVELIDRHQLGALLAAQCSEPVATGGRLLLRQVVSGVWPLVTLAGRVGLFPLWVLGWCLRVAL